MEYRLIKVRCVDRVYEAILHTTMFRGACPVILEITTPHGSEQEAYNLVADIIADGTIDIAED